MTRLECTKEKLLNSKNQTLSLYQILLNELPTYKEKKEFAVFYKEVKAKKVV